MPSYDYICPDGHAIEARHGMDEKPELKCTYQYSLFPHLIDAQECGKPLTRVYAPSGGEFVLGNDPHFARNAQSKPPPGRTGGRR